MLQIDLDKDEYDYICNAPFVKGDYKRFISSGKNCKDKFLLDLSEDQANELRDLCSEHLLLVGLDEQYNPTSEGKILESLIDKFFTG
jgi:hypothetical protein